MIWIYLMCHWTVHWKMVKVINSMLCTHACVLSCFSHIQLFKILWSVARQAPLSMGFSRQEYWSGLPCPPPGDLPDPGMEPTSPAAPALAGGFFTTSATWKAHIYTLLCIKQITNKEPTVQHRELGSIFCNGLYGKETLKKKGEYMYMHNWFT